MIKYERERFVATLYVGNLEWNTTEEELQGFFAGVDVTSVQILKDKETGRSGFVVVEADNVQDTITAYDGKELRGRTLKINEAREKGNRTDRSRGAYPR